MAYVYGAPRDPTDVVGRRITAYAIDTMFVLIGFVAVLALMTHQHRTGVPGDACAILRAQSAPTSGAAYHATCIRIASQAWLWKRSDLMIAVAVAALIGILDLLVLQAVTGASIGKHALGLTVVNEQGRPAGFGRTAVRWLFLVVDGGIFLIGLISVLVTHFHRRVGDFAAGTYVVLKAGTGLPVGVTREAVPYGGAVFAAPAPGLGGGSLRDAYPSPVPVQVPVPMPFAPGWGVAQPPPPPAAASSAWSTPPSAPPPMAPPAASAPPAPPVPAAPPAVQWAPPTAPSPVPAAPPPAPAAPPPAPAAPPFAPAAPPPAPAPPAPVQPAFNAPQPAAKPAPQPEAWWDTAIPDDPPDGEEQS